jgi:hypothetical protein
LPGREFVQPQGARGGEIKPYYPIFPQQKENSPRIPYFHSIMPGELWTVAQQDKRIEIFNHRPHGLHRSKKSGQTVLLMLNLPFLGQAYKVCQGFGV